MRATTNMKGTKLALINIFTFSSQNFTLKNYFNRRLHFHYILASVPVVTLSSVMETAFKVS